MKIKVVHYIKNLGFLILKFFLFVFLCSFIFNIGLGFWDNLKTEYDNYTFVRGFENFGVETTATCIDEEDNLIYEYFVGDTSYVFIRDELQRSAKTIQIYYDMLAPDIAIETNVLDTIDSFYSDVFKDISICYVKLVGAVFVFSLLWYVLDLLKHNKLIWRDAV